mgnify:CR=1 FL=1
MATQTPSQTKKVTEILNKQVANMALLYVKLHNYHWYVQGAEFYALHAKFEELYDEIAGYYDELAERMLALGERPAGTMAETLQLASLKEASGKEPTESMVGQTIHDFTTVTKELTEGIAAAESAGDQPTADIFISIRKSLEKHAWMLKAFLGQT